MIRMYDNELTIFFGLLSIGFFIFIFALLVRLWNVLGDIRETCKTIQQEIAAKKYPPKDKNENWEHVADIHDHNVPS